MARIDAFLKLGLAQGCSDVHLAVGVPPMLRMNGDLMPIKFRDLADHELNNYVSEILTQSQQAAFDQGNDLDFSYVTDEGGRFRVNLFRKDTGIGAVFRSIPGNIPTLEGLELPPVIETFLDHHQGMVLVTGSTGTGKSTTLAAMINHLNTTRNLNIISLEDPIEFVHESKRSQIVQRELGTHIPSFAEGVRAALRPHRGRRGALGWRHREPDPRRPGAGDRPHVPRPAGAAHRRHRARSPVLGARLAARRRGRDGRLRALQSGTWRKSR